MKRNHPSPPQTDVCPCSSEECESGQSSPAELTHEDWNPHPGQSYSAATKVPLHPHSFTPELTTHLSCQTEKPNSKQFKMYGGMRGEGGKKNQEAGGSHKVSSRGS